MELGHLALPRDLEAEIKQLKRVIEHKETVIKRQHEKLTWKRANVEMNYLKIIEMALDVNIRLPKINDLVKSETANESGNLEQINSEKDLKGASISGIDSIKDNLLEEDKKSEYSHYRKNPKPQNQFIKNVESVFSSHYSKMRDILKDYDTCMEEDQIEGLLSSIETLSMNHKKIMRQNKKMYFVQMNRYRKKVWKMIARFKQILKRKENLQMHQLENLNGVNNLANKGFAENSELGKGKISKMASLEKKGQSNLIKLDNENENIKNKKTKTKEIGKNKNGKTNQILEGEDNKRTKLDKKERTKTQQDDISDCELDEKFDQNLQENIHQIQMILGCERRKRSMEEKGHNLKNEIVYSQKSERTENQKISIFEKFRKLSENRQRFFQESLDIYSTEGVIMIKYEIPQFEIQGAPVPKIQKKSKTRKPKKAEDEFDHCMELGDRADMDIETLVTMLKLPTRKKIVMMKNRIQHFEETRTEVKRKVNQIKKTIQTLKFENDKLEGEIETVKGDKAKEKQRMKANIIKKNQKISKMLEKNLELMEQQGEMSLEVKNLYKEQESLGLIMVEMKQIGVKARKRIKGMKGEIHSMQDRILKKEGVVMEMAKTGNAATKTLQRYFKETKDKSKKILALDKKLRDLKEFKVRVEESGWTEDNTARSIRSRKFGSSARNSKASSRKPAKTKKKSEYGSKFGRDNDYTSVRKMSINSSNIDSENSANDSEQDLGTKKRGKPKDARKNPKSRFSVFKETSVSNDTEMIATEIALAIEDLFHSLNLSFESMPEPGNKRYFDSLQSRFGVLKLCIEGFKKQIVNFENQNLKNSARLKSTKEDILKDKGENEKLQTLKTENKKLRIQLKKLKIKNRELREAKILSSEANLELREKICELKGENQNVTFQLQKMQIKNQTKKLVLVQNPIPKSAKTPPQQMKDPEISDQFTISPHIFVPEPGKNLIEEMVLNSKKNIRGKQTGMKTAFSKEQNKIYMKINTFCSLGDPLENESHNGRGFFNFKGNEVLGKRLGSEVLEYPPLNLMSGMEAKRLLPENSDNVSRLSGIPARKDSLLEQGLERESSKGSGSGSSRKEA